MDASQRAESVTPASGISDRRLGVYVLLLLIFWVTVVAYTVHPVLPDNPIALPFEEKSPFIPLLPQGWGFFTRDPKSLDLAAFVKMSDGSWQPAPMPKRLWPHPPGFSRGWKLHGIEVGIIFTSLADPQWEHCQERPSACLAKAPLATTVENLLSNPTLCGEIGLVRQPPIPWAWREAANETVMPSEVLRLQVVCHD